MNWRATVQFLYGVHMSDRKNLERQSRSLRSTVIEPFSQVKLGIYVIAICAVFLVLSGLLFHNSFLAQYQHVLSIFEVTDPEMQWEVISNDIYRENLLKLGLLFLGFIVVMLSVIFRMTHKYYGPLVSIERFADAIADGKYFDRVAIRKGDELLTLVEKLNGMAKELERKHGSLVNKDGETVRRRKADTGSSPDENN